MLSLNIFLALFLFCLKSGSRMLKLAAAACVYRSEKK